MEECNRLKEIIQELVKSKDPLMDPKQRNEIDKKFMEQNIIIEQLRSENVELEKAYHDKEMELLSVRDDQTKVKDTNKVIKRDVLSRQKKLHTQAIKSKNREIQKLKEEISNMTKMKEDVNKHQTDLKKEKIRASDLVKQRGRLESQIDNYKESLTNKNQQNIEMAKEIASLKQEVEKYKKLYTNAKSSMTPFSEFKMDNMTEATQGLKPTPTDLKIEERVKKEQPIMNKDLVQIKQINRSSIKPSPKQQIGATPEVELKGDTDRASEHISEPKEKRIVQEDSDNDVDEQIQKVLDSDEDKVTEKNFSTKAYNEIDRPLEQSNHNLIEDISQNVIEDTSQNIIEDTSQNIIEDTSQNVIEEISQNVIEDIIEDDDITEPKRDNSNIVIETDAHKSMEESKSDTNINLSEIKHTPSNIHEDTSPNLQVPKPVLNQRVSIVDIPKDVKTEFRLILQNNHIPYEKIKSIFPNTNRVQLSQLIDHFKSLNRFEDAELLEQVCRYLVENDTQGDIIPYDENADIDMIAIVSKFKNKIVEEDYSIFDETNDLKKKEIEKLKREITQIIKP